MRHLFEVTDMHYGQFMFYYLDARAGKRPSSDDDWGTYGPRMPRDLYVALLKLHRSCHVRRVPDIERAAQHLNDLKLADAEPSLCRSCALGRAYVRLNDLGAQGDLLARALAAFRDAEARAAQARISAAAVVWIKVALGRTLELSGRTVEAYDAYVEALALDPQCSEALAGQTRIVSESMALFPQAMRILCAQRQTRRALSQHKGREFADSKHRSDCYRTLEQLGAHVRKVGLDVQTTDAQRGRLGLRDWNPDQARYGMFCQSRGLMLNLCGRCEACVEREMDGLRLVVDEQEHADLRMVRIARVVNELREAYSTGRYLYYQGLGGDESLLAVDEMTPYGDTLDFGVYGVRAGLLKSALVAARHLLDGIPIALSEAGALGPSWADQTVYGWRVLSDLIECIDAEDSGQLSHLRAMAAIAQEACLADPRVANPHRMVVPHASCLAHSVTRDAVSHLSFGDLASMAERNLKLGRRLLIHLMAYLAEREGLLSKAQSATAHHDATYDHELMQAMLG